MTLIDETFEELKCYIKDGNLKINEKMSNHTTLNVGGCASIFIEPYSEDEIRKTVIIAQKNNIPLYIIGRGSNLLISDRGLAGIVLKIADKLSCSILSDNSIIVNSGTSLASVSKMAYKNSLTGLEFASGIPGTIGGAVAMNAGAYGGEMKDIIEWVKVMKEDGSVVKLKNEDLNFSYRKSIFSENPNWVILAAKINLRHGDKDSILKQMMERNEKRVSSQPLSKNNCGSVFKRPEGYFAGKLIEDCGLKGFKYNGVEVSSKHAGFITTSKTSTASDVLHVINLVKEKVRDRFDIQLQEEVKILK